MKCFTMVLLALLVGVSAVGAITLNGAPQVINYQGRLTDAGGTPLADGPHGVEFRIWADSTSSSLGNLLWDSGPTTVTTDKGLFSVKLGSPPQSAFSYLPFYDSLIFLGITVGADPEIAPRTRLTSVPFAMTAQNAVTANSAGTAYYLVPSSMPAAGTISVGLSPTISGTPVAIGQFTVTAPGAGYLTINASGMMYLDQDATGTAAVTGYFYIGLCSSPGSSGTCGGTYDSHFVQDADASDSNNSTPTYSLNEMFYVPAAGTYTYYINAASGVSLTNVYAWSACQVNVLFTPGTLTITSPAPTNPSAGPQKQ
jgi:hypothetical protein